MKSLYLCICALFLFCGPSFGQSVTGIINDVRCDLKCNKAGNGYQCDATISWMYALRSSAPRAKAPHFNYYILLTGDDGKRTLTKVSYDPIENCWRGVEAVTTKQSNRGSPIVDDEEHSLNMPEMVVGNLKEALLRNVGAVLRSSSNRNPTTFTNRQKILLTRAEIWQDGKMILFKNMYTPLHVIKAEVPEDWWIIGKYPDKMSYSR